MRFVEGSHEGFLNEFYKRFSFSVFWHKTSEPQRIRECLSDVFWVRLGRVQAGLRGCGVKGLQALV